MIGKSPNYLRDIPPLNDPYPETRDNVCRDDDLALRALKPEFRPKRGRRRADEQDEPEPLSAIEPKRPHLDTPFSAHPQSAYPSSAVPMSAHPDDMDFSRDPWAMAPASGARAPSGAAYRFQGGGETTPMTPNPLSAVTPLSAHPDSAFDESPAAAGASAASSVSQSQKMRMRRRHGTAVSSAWPSNSTTPNGKLRGRPPTNRSVKDGPFVTFPANPRAREGPAIDLNRNTISTGGERTTPPPPGPSQSPNSPFRVPQMPAGASAAAASMPTPVSASSTTSKSGIGAFPSGRPERLSLQVPQHIGNPVRLVTPTVVVNGADQQQQQQQMQPAQGPTPSSAHHPYSRDFSFAGTRGGMQLQSAASTPSSALPPHHHQHQHYPPHAHQNPYHQQQQHQAPPPPGFTPWTHEELRRALAADLLRADVSGRAKPLRGTEARALADALLAALRARAAASPPDADGALPRAARRRAHSAGPRFGPSGAPAPPAGGAAGADEAARLACARRGWASRAAAARRRAAAAGAVPAGAGAKRIRVRRFRERGDGYESPMDEDEPDEEEAAGGTPTGTPPARRRTAPRRRRRRRPARRGGRPARVRRRVGAGHGGGRRAVPDEGARRRRALSDQAQKPPPGGAGAGGETLGGDEDGAPEAAAEAARRAARGAAAGARGGAGAAAREGARRRAADLVLFSALVFGGRLHGFLISWSCSRSHILLHGGAVFGLLHVERRTASIAFTGRDCTKKRRRNVRMHGRRAGRGWSLDACCLPVR